MLNYHPASEALTFELLNSSGGVVAVASQASQKRISMSNLTPGNYLFRVGGSPARKVEFVVKAAQAASQ
jgi:hypothetical protein